jgi:DNA-binding CsgD family transcriptional regulator
MTAPAPIIGRARELATLRSVVDSVRAGKSRIAFVEGEAGIGKSRLLAEVLEASDVTGVLVLGGKADELHGARPFGAIADALAGSPRAPIPRRAVLDTALAGSKAIALPADMAGPQFRVVDTMVELLEEIALRGPVIVALDDLQWADHATLLTVRAVAARLETFPVGLIGAFRPVPRNPALDGIVDRVVRTGGVHVRLGSLSSEEVAELARRYVGDEPGPKLLHRIAGAAGNPLFVSEMLAALVEEGAIAGDAGMAEVQDVALPAPLRLTILRRMSGLSDVTLETLRAGAALGATFAVADLVAVTGRTALELSSILSEPLRARIVEEADDRLRFRHDLIREAIYQDLPLGLRQELHCQAARALALAGREPVEIAQQYLLGASPNDQDAIAWLRRAAEDAAARAPASAIEFLQRAADLAREGDPQRHRICVRLADLLAYSGRPAEAEALVESLLAGREDPTQDGRLLHTLIQALFAQGRWREIPEVAGAALVRVTVDDAMRARVLAESALAHIWTGDLDTAEAEAREALRLGEEADDGVAMWNALGNLSAVADKRGRFHEGVELARRGLDLAREAGTDTQRRNPHIALAMALVTADRLHEAIDVLQEGRLQGERLGTLWDLPLYHAMVSLPLQSLGQWDRAVAEAEAALACAEEVGAGGGRVGALGTLARIAIRRNRLDEAARHVEMAQLIIDQTGPQWGSVPVVGLLEAHGDLDEATKRLGAGWESAVRRGIVEGQVAIGPELVRLALATGSRSYACQVAEALQTLAAMVNVPVADAGALLSKGRLSGDPETLLAAVEAYRKGHRTPALADAGEVAAVALAHAGRSSEAVSLLEETVATFEALGAQRDLARVRSTMRELGLRRGTRSPHRTARSGWDALTQTESEIVTLTAQGLTNPEIGRRLFISPRTVQSHLSHVFLKLGVASRVELAARAASRWR